MKTLDQYIEGKKKEVAIMLAGKFNVKTSGATNDFLDLIDEILRDTARETVEAVVPEVDVQKAIRYPEYIRGVNVGYEKARERIIYAAKERGIIS